MKHAVIVTGGKQYRVAEGDVIFVEKLDVLPARPSSLTRFWPLLTGRTPFSAHLS